MTRISKGSGRGALAGCTVALALAACGGGASSGNGPITSLDLVGVLAPPAAMGNICSYSAVGANSPLLAHGVVDGRTASGLYVQSQQIQFTVDVCNGCLVSFPSNVSNLSAYCSGATGATATASPCLMGQDQPVDCQKCYPLAACTGANGG